MTTIDKTAIRNAATVVVLRKTKAGPQVLMGQRGENAAFMPSKFVFPGGAMDAGDAAIPLLRPLSELCIDRLCDDAAADHSHGLAAAAIRELWEETGLILGQPGGWPGPVPSDWAEFAARGYLPDAEPMQFIFRAITPPGRPRRFDARFFLVPGDAIASDLDDFSAASEELSHLQWVLLRDARSFDLPFITQVVLAEVEARAHDPAPPASIPFFRNDDEESLFLRLRGRAPQPSPTE